MKVNQDFEYCQEKSLISFYFCLNHEIGQICLRKQFIVWFTLQKVMTWLDFYSKPNGEIKCSHEKKRIVWMANMCTQTDWNKTASTEMNTLYLFSRWIWILAENWFFEWPRQISDKFRKFLATLTRFFLKKKKWSI